MTHDERTGTGTGTGASAPDVASSIWTVPNLVTLIRLLCLPIFLYLLFAAENRPAAAFTLGALGATDWVDGYLARRLGQVSEFGKKFDPTVDRLLLIVGLIAILVDGSMPMWFGLAILIREVAVGGTVAVATLALHMERFDVTFWGKLSTFLLMFAVPGFLLGASDFPGAAVFQAVSWILGIPGLVISYATAIAYIPRIRDGIREGKTRQRRA